MFQDSPNTPEESSPSEPVAAGAHVVSGQPGESTSQRGFDWDTYLPECAPATEVRPGRDGGDWLTEVAELPAGQLLLAELLETGLSTSTDIELVAVLKQWERVEAWVAARHHEALSALAVREHRFGGFRQTAAVLASELRCTQYSAESSLARARSLCLFPVVWDALESGELDLKKSETIVTEAQGAPEGSAQQVAMLGVALAPSKTAPQLRRALAAAVLGLDPAAATERNRQAVAERRVEFLPLPDSMALISAILPAADAMAVKTALDALARTGGAEDPRTFDQRRADALSAIFHAICDAGEVPLHPEHLKCTGAEEAVGEGTGAGAGAGAGADADKAVREGTGATGEATGTGVGDSAGCPTHEGVEGLPSGAGEVRGTRDRASEGCGPLWRRLATSGRHRAHLQVTVAGTTLLGLDDQPGELAGYGPIPADVARTIAGDATWRAVLTDPRLGTVTAVGEHSYRPGAVLSRDVMARDRTCTFIGCSQPAYRCDLDHREPFDPRRPAAEQTCLDNLHALCRFHHNLKTLHGWRPTFDPTTGVTSWTSPLGTTHHRDPEPALPPWEEWLTKIETLPRVPSPCPCAATDPSSAHDQSSSPALNSVPGRSSPPGPRSGPDPSPSPATNSVPEPSSLPEPSSPPPLSTPAESNPPPDDGPPPF